MKMEDFTSYITWFDFLKRNIARCFVFKNGVLAELFGQMV